MIKTERGAALVLAAAVAAIVVKAEVEAPGLGLGPAQHQVAGGRRLPGLDLDVDLGGGHALEVF